MVNIIHDDNKKFIKVIQKKTLRGGGGERHLKPPKFEHIFVSCHNFFPLSSVQILLIPVCYLLCVL